MWHMCAVIISLQATSALSTRNYNFVYFARVSVSVLNMVECFFSKNSSTYVRWIEVTVIKHSKCLMGGKLVFSLVFFRKLQPPFLLC